MKYLNRANRWRCWLRGHRWTVWVRLRDQGEQWEERICLVCAKTEQRTLA